MDGPPYPLLPHHMPFFRKATGHAYMCHMDLLVHFIPFVYSMLHLSIS